MHPIYFDAQQTNVNFIFTEGKVKHFTWRSNNIDPATEFPYFSVLLTTYFRRFRHRNYSSISWNVVSGYCARNRIAAAVPIRRSAKCIGKIYKPPPVLIYRVVLHPACFVSPFAFRDFWSLLSLKLDCYLFEV